MAFGSKCQVMPLPPCHSPEGPGVLPLYLPQELRGSSVQGAAMEHLSQTPERTGNWPGWGWGRQHMGTSGAESAQLFGCSTGTTATAHQTPKQQRSRLASGPFYSPCILGHSYCPDQMRMFPQICPTSCFTCLSFSRKKRWHLSLIFSQFGFGSVQFFCRPHVPGLGAGETRRERGLPWGCTEMVRKTGIWEN